MEPNTSSENLNTSCDDELDVSNIIKDFIGLDVKKEKPVDNATIVFFSLDTTDRKGSTRINEICQIAAACKGSNGEINQFQVYMKPEKYGIAPSISVSKGYKMGTDGRLLLGENEVDASTQRVGLEFFLKFLSEQSGESCSVLLAAHECDEIYRPILLRHMAEYNLLPACQNLVLGFIDIRTAIRRRLQERYDLAANDRYFWLKNLARTYLRLNILRERADVSVQAVISLIDCPAINCTEEMLVELATIFNFNAYILLVELMRDFHPVQDDFELTQVAIDAVQPARNGVSVEILSNIARAGISSAMLQTEHIVHNGDVSNLLRRVTRSQAAIDFINATIAAMRNAN